MCVPSSAVYVRLTPAVTSESLSIPIPEWSDILEHAGDSFTWLSLNYKMRWVLYFYARVALKILFLNEPPGELRNRILNATSA